jgi:hypothetical protein
MNGDAAAQFQQILQQASADPRVVGLFLGGSRGSRLTMRSVSAGRALRFRGAATAFPQLPGARATQVPAYQHPTEWPSAAGQDCGYLGARRSGETAGATGNS